MVFASACVMIYFAHPTITIQRFNEGGLVERPDVGSEAEKLNAILKLT